MIIVGLSIQILKILFNYIKIIKIKNIHYIKKVKIILLSFFQFLTLDLFISI